MNLTPKIARLSPYEMQVKAGRHYAWCACGLSKRQPLCDGSHSGTGLEPVTFKAEKDETVWLCGCKRSKTQPFCDSTHRTL